MDLIDLSPLPIPSLPTPSPLLCSDCPLSRTNLELRQQVGYWQAMHRRACDRELALHDRVAQLQAQIRLLQHQFFGRSSESHQPSDQLPNPNDLSDHTPLPETPPPETTAPETTAPETTTSTQPQRPRRRARGQQRGQRGHGRRRYDHLPTIDEDATLSPDQCQCPDCGQPFASFPGTEDTTILEIDVKAHRRRVRRQRYRPTCSCGTQPGIVTAPPPPRLIPKSPFGVSIWVTVLLDKYLFHRPTARLLDDWRTHGLDLAQGSLTGGLQQLLPLFEPLYQALIARNQQADQWHADETRWQVFATIEGKIGYRWYLWLFESAEVQVFVLAAGRAHDVPETHFGPEAEGILVVDRYKAYQAIDQVKTNKIVLAFCWAHQRRDFVELARAWPTLLEWVSPWLERIRHLYALNARRLELREDSEGFEQRDQDLRLAVSQMSATAEAELATEGLPPACRKVLESLGDHWEGLTVFVEHPEVPMDNNRAERSERGPVVGRKNYYGSGSVWSGRLAAMLFSLLGTLRLGGINPRLWLTAYLESCASRGGQVPERVEEWLPWKLSEEKKKAWGERGSSRGNNTS